MAVKAAEKGDYKGVIKYHVFGAQLTTFLLRFVPGFLVLYFGADYVINLTNAAPAWTIHAPVSYTHLDVYKRQYRCALFQYLRIVYILRSLFYMQGSLVS